MRATWTSARYRPATTRAGLGCVLAAMVLGLLYAAISVYWALGGTALLETVGGALEQATRASTPTMVLVLWAAVLLKAIAAVLPLAAFGHPRDVWWRRPAKVLSWIAAAVLVLYGLTLTVGGLVTQLGLIPVPASANHRALAWHTYLWDPWFMLWGLLLVAALLRDQRQVPSPSASG